MKPDGSLRLLFRCGLLLLFVGYVCINGFSDSSQVNSVDHASRGLLQEKPDPLAEYILDPGHPKDAFSADQIRGGAFLLYVIGVLYMFIALAIVCDEWFVPALEVIVEWIGMSNDVAGATFMAAGGSAPELFTSFIGTFSGSAVGFGTIVGSAVFNVLFVIGMCVLYSKEALVLTWWPLLRDCTYYAISLGVLAIFFGVNTPYSIDLWEAIVLFVMYIGYFVLMWNNERLYAKVLTCRKRPAIIAEDVGDDTEMQATGADADAEAPIERRNTNRARALSLEQQPANLRRPSKFRAGFLQMMFSNKPILETAGIHVVHKICGDVHDTFDKLDADNSGSLEAHELKELLVSLGSHPSDELVNDMLADLDQDKDGKVSFEEFQTWYLKSETRILAELEGCFEEVDNDDDGRINREELKQVLVMMEQTPDIITDEFADAVLKELDDNGDGFVDKAEFSQWYKKSDLWAKRKAEGAEDAEVVEGVTLNFPKTLRARIMYVITFPLVLPMYFTLPNVRKPRWKRWAVFTFFMSIVWIGVFSFLMVWWATIAGYAAGISPKVMGLTFLAAGTSIPDLLSSVIVAKQGEGDMAVSSSIGSNIFDILVGLPLPWILKTAIDGRSLTVDAAGIEISIAVLFVMIILIIVTIAAVGWKLNKALAAVFFTMYILFVVQDLLISYGVIKV